MIGIKYRSILSLKKVQSIWRLKIGRVVLKNNNYIPPRSFRIYPEVTKVDINMKMHGLKKKCLFKNYYIRQYRVLVNIETTGHKLQGMSKDNVIVVNWLYGVKNWVYVVLSRVRTLSGLYLFKPLDTKNIINRTTNSLSI